MKVQGSGWGSREAPPALTCFRALRGRKVLSPLHRCLGRVLHSLGRAGRSGAMAKAQAPAGLPRP